jgi:hypothetical protein
MKFLGMALAVGVVLGPLGAIGVGYAVAGAIIAIGIAAVGGGVASTLGYSPAKELPQLKDWH